jgi:nucleoside-diphosphate-sugar epimerase
MNNILCLGASGYLGSYLTDRFKCITTAKRFQWSADVWRYDLAHQYDFVFLLARTCRKHYPRRDRLTMMDEVGGVVKVLTAHPRSHIVFTSTKCVYGVANEEERPMTREDIGDYFERVLNGEFINKTIDLPRRDDGMHVSLINALSDHHRIYADTKICDELLIKNCAHRHTIMRIWDII